MTDTGHAATFGWLCVETFDIASLIVPIKQPPSGGCVLKHTSFACFAVVVGAATFGWLCVETAKQLGVSQPSISSHLRVAVC